MVQRRMMDRIEIKMVMILGNGWVLMSLRSICGALVNVGWGLMEVLRNGRSLLVGLWSFLVDLRLSQRGLDGGAVVAIGAAAETVRLEVGVRSAVELQRSWSRGGGESKRRCGGLPVEWRSSGGGACIVIGQEAAVY